MIKNSKEVDPKTDEFGRELTDLMEKYGKTTYMVSGMDDGKKGFSLAVGTGTNLVTLVYLMMVEFPEIFSTWLAVVLRIATEAGKNDAFMSETNQQQKDAMERLNKQTEGIKNPAVMGSVRF